jgi:hypothetical protein
MNATFPESMLPRWAAMWFIAFGLYGFCKVLSWGWRAPLPASRWKSVVYLVAWPGMDPDTFLATPRSRIERPALSEWGVAIAKTALGAALLTIAIRLELPAQAEWPRWIGMTGLILLLHFGIFHLLSCVWRALGMNAVPIMNQPAAARSLAEFWGRRWNLAFRDLAHRFVFLPLLRWMHPTSALLAGFAISGLIHELVISVPAGGGYGWPTAYFVIQGLGVMFERSGFGRSLGLGRGVVGRLYCLGLVVVPCGWLFPRVFVLNVIGPFLDAIGGV